VREGGLREAQRRVECLEYSDLPVGATGRAPGCGAGGPSALTVVVAETGAGIVRVGAGVSGSAVFGVTPSTVGFMGASLWIGIGGILGDVLWW
jgi:hypothetical protein